MREMCQQEGQDPEVFLCAAQRLGLSPKACVVIEDAPAGIEAARGAGLMRNISVLVGSPGLSCPDLSSAPFVARRFLVTPF